MYRYLGDVGIVQKHWVSLKLYLGYWDGEYKKHGIAKFDSGFGDWVNAARCVLLLPGRTVPVLRMSTYFFAVNVLLTAIYQTAMILTLTITTPSPSPLPPSPSLSLVIPPSPSSPLPLPLPSSPLTPPVPKRTGR